MFLEIKKVKKLLFDQIFFLDRLKFDPIFGDFTSFLRNKMIYQNKNLQYEKSRSRNIQSIVGTELFPFNSRSVHVHERNFGHFFKGNSVMNVNGTLVTFSQ